MCSYPCESELTCFWPESNRGPYGLLNFVSAALSTNELWWRMNHRKFFRTPDLKVSDKLSNRRVLCQSSRTQCLRNSSTSLAVSPDTACSQCLWLTLTKCRQRIGKGLYLRPWATKFGAPKKIYCFETIHKNIQTTYHKIGDFHYCWKCCGSQIRHGYQKLIKHEKYVMFYKVLTKYPDLHVSNTWRTICCCEHLCRGHLFFSSFVHYSTDLCCPRCCVILFPWL